MRELKFMENQEISESTAMHIGDLIVKFKRVAKIFSLLILVYMPILILFFNKMNGLSKTGMIVSLLTLCVTWFYFKRKSNLLTLHFNLQCWFLEMLETPYKMKHYIHVNNIKA